MGRIDVAEASAATERRGGSPRVGGATTRILLADRHAVVRRGVAAIAAQRIARVEFGEASDARAAFALATTSPWDALVIDPLLPGRGGVETIAELHHARPELPVLVLTAQPEDQVAVRALRAGAAGYVPLDAAAEEIGDAIDLVVAGGTYVRPSLAGLLARQLRSPGDGPPHATLSDRELHVVCRISAGKPVSAIAREMCLSVKTVSTYRARALAKMHLANNAELTRYALEHHLEA